MSDMFPVCMQLVKGCQTLVMDPSNLLQQSLVSRACLMPSWCTDIYSGQGENSRIWPKSGLTFWPHIIDVWHVPSVYVAYVKCCQTLVMDPTSLLTQSLVNTVTHTIMVHWYLLWSGRECQDLTKIWPNLLTTHHWSLTCSKCVCSLRRALRPW